ncbi:MAG: carbamoyltransferase [Flavobacteriaceae bacterium]
MKILGISCFYHDSAATIIVDNEILASVQEERFTRIKHTPDFPKNSIRFCLEETGLRIEELDAVVFYDKPIVKFERLLSTFYQVAPKGLIPFIKSIPIWLKEKLFLRKLIYDNLKEIEPNLKKKDLNFLFTEHHVSHAASSFYPSNFKESAILTIDGVGEWSTASICKGVEKKIEILKELYFPHSVGLLYSAFTYYLGFRVNSGEYKLMGLAPYGNENSEETSLFIEKIKSEIVDIKEDGSIFLNQEYFKYTYGLRMIKENKFKSLFGIATRKEQEDITQTHCNMALSIQKITEEIVIKMVKETKKLTNSNNLCLSGGVALNCVANGKIEELGIFENIYIQPAAGDAGGSLGAALAINHMYFNCDRVYSNDYDLMKGSYLGPYFSEKEILINNKKYKAVYKHIGSFEKLSGKVAKLISEGNVVGWFQGRSEFGPRALGNRSILADPRNPDMQKKLNLKIKYREGFRPFAPSVLEEDYKDYFEGDTMSPYMLLVKKIHEKIKIKIPSEYWKLNYWDKLYTNRSKLQSITHVDFSARIQTVSKKTNFRYWSLINEFKKITGVGVLVNTSFNVRGEPIVNSPEDAFRCFMNTEMDVLVIENFIYLKKEQKIKIIKDEFKKD